MIQPDTVCIRPTTPDDLDALVSLSRETSMASFSPFLGEEAVSAYLDAGDLERFLAAHIDSGWVILVDEAITGVAMAEGSTLGQLMIDHRLHRRGLGTRLLAHVEEWLFEAHDTLELQSFEANDATNAFYRAQGWREAERIADEQSGIPMFVFRKEKAPMANPLRGATVGFIKIPVSDFGRACAFYRDTLGLQEEFAVEAFGWAQYATGSVPICLYQEGMGGGAGTPGGDTGIQLRVTDARTAYEHLKDHAGDFGEGDDGSAGFTLTDPDGNTLQVMQVG